MKRQLRFSEAHKVMWPS